MRNNGYDSLPITMNQLKQITEHKSNIILKGEDPSTYEEYLRDEKVETTVAAGIYNQFVALKKDYESGSINLVWYKNILGTIKTYLEENKDINPKSLHRSEIEQEIKRYL